MKMIQRYRLVFRNKVHFGPDFLLQNKKIMECIRKHQTMGLGVSMGKTRLSSAASSGFISVVDVICLFGVYETEKENICCSTCGEKMIGMECLKRESGREKSLEWKGTG